MGVLRRAMERLAQSDEERLAEEVRAWAASVPGALRIGDAPLRKRSKFAGVVRRITVRPIEGSESLEVLLFDGTDEVGVVWMGRRMIPGLSLGTRIVVEGVLSEQRSGRKIVNPSFEFSA